MSEMDQKRKEMCHLVDNFLTRGWSEEYASSQSFWEDIMTDIEKAQMFTECLVFKFVALKVGLGREDLYANLGRIRRMSGHENFNQVSSDPTLTVNDKTLSPKHDGGRKRSIDKRKSTSSENIKGSGLRKRSGQNLKNEENKILQEERSQALSDSKTVLNTMNYVTSLCELVKWDFNKLREVFLIWNKVRGWNLAASVIELSVMKRLSIAPNRHDYVDGFSKYIAGQFGNMPASTQPADCLKYWKYRSDIIKGETPTEVIFGKLLEQFKDTFRTSDSNKLMALLFIFREILLLSTYVPLETLEEAYKVLSMFYVWNYPISQEVEDLLTFIQYEMKCPGSLYRANLLQMLGYGQSLKSEKRAADIHILVDENLPESENLVSCLYTLKQTKSSMIDGEEIIVLRFFVTHIYQSMFGEDCNIETVNNILKKCCPELARKFCYDVIDCVNNPVLQDMTIDKARKNVKKQLEDFSLWLTEQHDNQDKPSSEESEPTRSHHCFHYPDVNIHYLTDDLPHALVHDCAMNEKVRMESQAQKRDSTHLRPLRDSGIMDTSDSEMKSQLVSTPEKILESQSNSFAKLAEENEAEDFWNGFLENGFGTGGGDVEQLMRSFSITEDDAGNIPADDLIEASKAFSASIEQNLKSEEVFSPCSTSSGKKVTRKNSITLTKISQFSMKKFLNKKRLSDRKKHHHLHRSPTSSGTQESQKSASSPAAINLIDTSPLPTRWRTSSDPQKKSRDSKGVRETSVSFTASTPTTRRRDSVYKLNQGSPIAKRVLTFGQENDLSQDSIRQRTDSGFEDANTRINCRKKRRNKVFEEKQIGGVRLVRIHSSRIRGKIKSQTKKVIKLIAIGNDSTLSQLTKSYIEMKSSTISSVPLLGCVDLHLYFIPLHSVGESTKIQDSTSQSISKLIGSCDAWYKKILLPTVDNLSSVLPHKYGATSACLSDESSIPENILGNAIHSYITFAHKDVLISLYKVVVVSSTEEVKEHFFTSKIEIGHTPYKRAVEAGRFGKLVDLSSDSTLPPAYSEVTYTKLTLDKDVGHTTEREALWYHTAVLQPMELWKNNYKGSGNLVMSFKIQEKKSKNNRRGSHAKISGEDELQHITSLDSVKFTVVKPSQATVVICLDNSTILTNVKSVEVCRYFTTPNTISRRKSMDSDLIPFQIPIKTFSNGMNP